MKDWNEKYNQNQLSKSSNSLYEDDFDLFYSLSEFDTDVDVDKGWEKISSKISASKPIERSFSFLWKIAAILVLGIALGTIVYTSQFDQTVQSQTITSTNQVQEIVFPDGSIVTVAAGSSITFIEDDFLNNRTLNLTGQAYFDVVKTNTPFYIQSEFGNVKVLGTTFNVNAKNELKVVVESGTVEISKGSNSEKIRKGYSGQINSSGDITIFPTASLNELGWKTGYFSFDNKELSEVIRVLEEYSASDIVASRSLRDCKITAEFKNKSLTSVVNVIGSVLNAKTKITDKKVRISGKGCN